MRVLAIAATLLSLACDFAQCDEPTDPGPKSPTEALLSMVVPPGFEVELVACEPLVMDPVAFAWGPDGKFWVVEMADYPLGLDGKGKFGGRVKYLEDTDGDGLYDRATLFLDGLGYPTGVMPWRKGVLVTCAPEILYAEDTDGDGKADVREQLYVGFGEGNQQHRVNGLRWGLDNWIYCANGDSGGTIKSIKTGETLNISGRDFRIRPDDGRIEPQTGQTQFGRDCDDWGNWFGSKNSNPLLHWVMPDEYLRRNPFLPAGQTFVEVPNIPGAAPVYPASKTLARFNDLSRANRFTSACGGCIYRDELLGPEFAGNAFVCEPVHNLVHREVLEPKGVTFTSHRAAGEETAEFLASTDNWFRPVMARTGPDGALWVADMYRQTIEHPQWIPKEWQARLDLRAGHDRGRIYRVYPTSRPPREIRRLHRRDPDELARDLENPSGTARDMVQQLLLEKYSKHPAALFRLRHVVHDSHLPAARAQALWTLAGMDSLTPEVLAWALEDVHPGVQRQALRLAERAGTESGWGESLEKLLPKLVDSPDAGLRMQFAFMLGSTSRPEAVDALASLLASSSDDPFIVTAALTSLHKSNLLPVVNACLAHKKKTLSPLLIDKLTSLAVGFEERNALLSLVSYVAAISPADQLNQFAALEGLLEGLGRRQKSLASLRRGSDEALNSELDRLGKIFDAARQMAADNSIDDAKREKAIAPLGRGPDRRDDDIKLLGELLAPRTSSRLHSAAVSALARLDGPVAAESLLAGWSSYSPELRGQVLDALLAREAWTELLLSAIEKRGVSPTDINATRAQRLLEHKNTTLRDRAKKLLAGSVNTDRQKVVQEYQDVLELTGDATRGAEVFKKKCSTCHRLGDVGHAVGPDLAALTDKSVGSLLVATLDPNKAVETKFVNYVAITASGLVHTGMLESESSASITLLAPEAKRVSLLRADLEELASTNKSLMPEGLEKDLSRQDLADVFAMIHGMKPPRKTFAGNNPQLVQPEALRGEFYLLAEQAEIYGSTLVFESKYGNLGYWQSENDHAIWSVAIERPGEYEISIEYACADGSAGNTVIVDVGNQRVAGKVNGTGNWDTYKSLTLGKVMLEAGTQQVVVRSDGKPREALLDLKSVRVRPLKL